MHLAGHPQLRDQQEIIIGGHIWIPIDNAHRLNRLSTLRIAYANSHPILQQPVYLAIGINKTENIPGAGQLLNSQPDSLRRERRIETMQSRTQPWYQHDLGGRFAPQYIGPIYLLVGIDRL